MCLTEASPETLIPALETVWISDSDSTSKSRQEEEEEEEERKKEGKMQQEYTVNAPGGQNNKLVSWLRSFRGVDAATDEVPT